MFYVGCASKKWEEMTSAERLQALRRDSYADPMPTPEGVCGICFETSEDRDKFRSSRAQEYQDKLDDEERANL